MAHREYRAPSRPISLSDGKSSTIYLPLSKGLISIAHLAMDALRAGRFVLLGHPFLFKILKKLLAALTMKLPALYVWFNGKVQVNNTAGKDKPHFNLTQ